MAERKGFCPRCQRVACSCPEEEFTPTPITKVERPIRKASDARTVGERQARYQDQHLCMGCNHSGVCEVGRHTSELFMKGWLVSIGDCDQFEEYKEDDSDEQDDKR